MDPQYNLHLLLLIWTMVHVVVLLHIAVVIAKSWWLKDHSRWVFRKNSMEFSIRFDYLLILLYKWLCPTITQSHVLPECSMITWSYHMIWLLNPPCYLYLCFCCTIWCWRSNVQICRKLFPFWGSHNSGILNPLHTVSEFCFDSSNPLTIQFQYLELFFLFLLMVWYSAGGKKRVTLDGALNRFKLVMRLSISSDNYILGFLDAETIAW